MFGLLYPGEIYPGQSDRLFAINYEIITNDIGVSLSEDSATISQNHLLSPNDTALSLSLDSTTLVQAHSISVADTSLGLSIDTTAVAVTHIVDSNDILISLTEDGSTVKRITNYTYEDESTLGTDDADLSGGIPTSDVESDDNTYFDTNGSSNIVNLFKYTHTNSTDAIEVTWKGKTTLAPSTSTVYLQIYNQDSDSWETIDSDSSTGADTEFTLNAVQSADVADYYDSDVVTARVYQVVP